MRLISETLKNQTKRFVLALSSIGFLFVLAGCGGDKTVIVSSPTVGSFSSSSPDVILGFPDGRPNDFSILLNNERVNDLFQITDNGASSEGAILKDLFSEGSNNLKIRQSKITNDVDFFVDDHGPQVHITQTDVSGSDNYSVSGYMKDFSSTQSLILNNSSAPLTASNSSTKHFFNDLLVNTDFNTFDATDNIGHASTVTYVRQETPIDDALAIRMSQRGLDRLEPIVDGALSSPLDFILPVLNPVFFVEEGWTWPGCEGPDCIYLPLLSVQVDVTRLVIDGSALDLATRSTNADGPAMLIKGPLSGLDLDIDITIWIPVVGAGTYSINATIDQADLDIETILGIEDESLTFSKTARSANNTNTGAQITFTNFALNLENLTQEDKDHIDDFFNIFTFVEDKVGMLVEFVLLAILELRIEELLGILPDGITIGVIGDKNVIPAVRIMDVATPGGGLNLNVGMSVDNSSTGPRVLGYPYENETNTALPSSEDKIGAEHDIGITLHQNTINQILAGVTEAGLLNLTTEDVNLELIPGLFVQLRIIPHSAPSIDFLPNTNVGVGTLVFNDFDVIIETKGSLQEDWNLAMGLSLDLKATADLHVVDEKLLAIGIVGTPRININMVDPNGSLQFGPDTLDGLINGIILGFLPPLFDSLGAFPLPVVGGFGFTIAEFRVIDSEGEHLSIVGDLIVPE